MSLAAGKKKWLWAVICALLFAVCPADRVVATQETRRQLEEKKQEREQTKQELNQTREQLDETRENLDDKKEDIRGLNQQKNELEQQLDVLNDELSVVSEHLRDLEDQIEYKLNQISNTQEELEAAKIQEREQYASMKKRVQFLYEGREALLMELLLSNSFAKFLNYSQYVEQISSYDRRMLTNYEQNRIYIEEKEAELIQERAELEAYRIQVEAEQARVSGMVSQTSGNINRYRNSIQDAEAQARAFEAQAAAYEQSARDKEAQIEAQNAEIKALEAKIQEEIRLSRLAAKSTWRSISDVSFADGDRYLLANLIYCEAGAEPYEGKLAVGAVVINRVLSSVYPDTVVGVIYQSGQFSPVGSGRLALALAEGKATESCYRAADEAMSGMTNVGTCVYFRTPIPGLSGQQIGGHIFY
ncbi:MAG: cell wall hydrolase [Butyrivibrio sp.]|nr:cell wall hydrolase [Butyrivibrio sp.]